MADVAELAVRLVADDQASAKLQAVQRQLTSSETSLKGLATTAGLSSAAVGTAFAGMATAAFKMGEEWDNALDKIRISTGATGEALDTLKADVSAVAREVPVSLGEVSGAMAELSRRTQLAGEPLQALTKQVIDFSRITGSDAVQNARLVTRAFGDWSIATDDQVGFLDKLLRASQATGVSVTTLQEGLVRYGAPLRQLGFDLDESVAILGKFEKEGVNAELVLGSLRIALGEMARQGVPAREGLNDVITAIKGAGDASTANKLAMEIFGARAGPDMAAAIREGRLEIDQLTKDIRDGGETIQQAAADTDDGAQKFAIAANKMKVAFEPVSAGMFVAASSGLESLSQLGAGIDTFLAGSGKNMLEFRQAMAAGFAIGPTGETAPAVPLKIAVDEAASAAALDDFMTNVVGLPSIRAAGEDIGEELAEATGDGAEGSVDAAMAPWLKKLIDKGKEGAFNLKEALRDAGTDETAIAGVLAFANEIGVIDKAISQLTDRTIAAHIVALRNDGEQTEAAALAAAHLAAQTDSVAAAHTQATVAAVGNALAERDAAEALTAAKEAALGGALAIRDHAEALQREHDQALGGVLAIRAHTEALEAEKLAALGGSLAVFQHTQELERQRLAELQLSGAADARIASLTNAAIATTEYQARIKGLTADQKAYYDAVGQVLGQEEALARLRSAQAGNGPSLNTGRLGAPVSGTGYGTATGATGAAVPNPHDTGKTMAAGFRENVGSGPADFGREIGAGFRAAAGLTTFDRPAAGYGTLTATGYGGTLQGAQQTLVDLQRRQAEEIAAVYNATKPVNSSMAASAEASALAANQADAIKQKYAPQMTYLQAQIAGLQAVAEEAGSSVQAATTTATRSVTGLGQAFATTGTQVSRFAADASGQMYLVGEAAEQAAAQAQQAWAAALRAGETLIAGMNLGKGLTYGQIYGNTATQGGGLGNASTVQPGNYWGLPVVSPVTKGSLYGFANGGMVPEPSYLTSIRTGRTYATAAENGPEPIGGGGGTIVVQMPVTITGSDALRDPRLYEQLLDRGLTQAMRKRGLV